MAQIEYKNVTKEYESGKKILDDVSFKVDSGEFVFLVGSSGVGKSTLIKLLIREELPNSGEILFSGFFDSEDPPQENLANGEEVSLVDVNEKATKAVNILDLPREALPDLRRKIGVVFQDFKVLRSKNVFENVAVALEVVGAPSNEIKSVVPNVLGLVGLANKKESFPRELSGGEIQRLSIARALAHEPEVIVADEPTGMIDPKATDGVLQVLERINSLGTTIIMATHDNTIVDKMKKRVLRLEGGKIVSDKKHGKYDE